MPPLTTIGLSSSAGMRLRERTFSRIVLRSSGMPDDGAYRVWLRASASVIAPLMASGEFIQGSPPSKRQTFWPDASSSITRLRTLTISENPTLSNRRAGRGKGPSVIVTTSDDGPASRTHQEIENHSDDRKEEDEEQPEHLRTGFCAALEDRNDRNDVEHRDEDPEQGRTEHRGLLRLFWPARASPRSPSAA